MDFPFLQWSVLEQTRFESLTFLYFYQTFAEKCFWISFFHSNSLCEGLFCMYLHFMMSFANNSYFTEIEVTVLRPFIIRHWTKLFLWLLCQIVTLFWLDSSSVQHWHQMYIFGQVKKWVNDDPDIESFFFIPLLLHLCKNAIWFPFFIQEDLPIVWAESSVNWFHEN